MMLKGYKSTLISTWLFCVIYTCSAQLSSVNIAGEQFSGRIAYFSDDKSKVILGSTYISEDWMVGSVETRSGNVTKGLLRLNALKNEIEIITSDDTIVIDKTFEIERIKLGGLTFITTMVIEKRGNRNYINSHFMNLLATGNIELLKLFDVGKYHNSYVPYYMGGAGDGNMYYTIKHKYYYRKTGGSEARSLVKNKHKLADIFGISVKQLRELIRENRININSEAGLISLFTILNLQNENS